MNKAIIVTTIHEPTEAIKRFAAMKDWKLYVVGDKKTPHEAYATYECYLTPDEQELIDKELSDYIGWNTTARRVMGIVQAYRDGAEIIALVDDDNIPLENWGINAVDVFTNRVYLELYESENGVFDPLSVTNRTDIWHRGYPLHLVSTKNNVTKIGTVIRKVVVLTGLWNGAPDIDAVCRALHQSGSELSIISKSPYYGTDQISPFNSQNTMIAREAIPYYYFFPKQGRFDDIFASYVLQKYFPGQIAYTSPTVFQKRNPHNIVDDMRLEMHGYFVDPYKVREQAESIDQKFCDLYKKALG